MNETAGRHTLRQGAPLFIGGRARSRACGLCGYLGGLTRAHVPPQAAGNRGGVLRYRPGLKNGTLGPQNTPKPGGLFFETLCSSCNSRIAGGRYDPAYAEFSKRVAFTLDSRGLWLPGTVPPVNVAPGLVARSILIGMMAANPRLRINHPSLAEQLLNEEPEVRLPGGLQLRLALTRQSLARVAAAPSFMKVLQERLFYMALAEVWFRPLVWALVPEPGQTPQLGPDLFVAQGWADVTDWARYSVDRTSVDLRQIVSSLPLVVHPRASGRDEDNWIELSSDAAPLLEGHIP